MLDTLHSLISKIGDLGEFIGRNKITETQLVNNYGFTLSDIFHYARLNQIIDVNNLDVLELGGKLSRPLLKQVVRPKSWTSVGTYYDGEPHTTQGLEGPLLDLQPDWINVVITPS